ncbi:hypothetical protein [Halegenticoccus tardaugens]|uniref:hypothetical protein n=1 Tax=Halegenticoccus tardaugens TaxID=2071624 RepID=UPI00100A782B|nr:hypothetical protein [Halegenticoccus tardaugens]
MDIEDTLPIELPTTETSLTRTFYGKFEAKTPPFRAGRMSIAISHYLTLTRRVESGYWAGFFGISAAMLAYFHISPWAVEPPQDVMMPYANLVTGYLAFGIVLALGASVVIGFVHAAVLWTIRNVRVVEP